MNYIRRKKPELWGNLSSPILPTYMQKVRPRARCRPSGQPGGQANWPAKELACLARGKALPQRGNRKRELRSCWDSGEKGSEKKLPSLTFTYYIPNLTLPLNKGTIQQNIASVRCIGKLQSKFAAVFYLHSWSQFYSILTYFLFLILAQISFVYELVDILFLDL